MPHAAISCMHTPFHPQARPAAQSISSENRKASLPQKKASFTKAQNRICCKFHAFTMQMPDKKSLHAQKCVQANSRKRRAAVQRDGAGPPHRNAPALPLPNAVLYADADVRLKAAGAGRKAITDLDADTPAARFRRGCCRHDLRPAVELHAYE